MTFAPDNPQPGEDCCGSMANFVRYDRERRVYVHWCSYCAFECDESELVDGEKPHKVMEEKT